LFTAKNARLRAARRRAREQRAAQMIKTARAEPLRMADDAEPLLDELARLPEKLRAPLMLCELQGKGRAEAARILGCPEGTLSSRLARGRALLRKRLAQRGMKMGIAALGAFAASEKLSAAVPATLIASTMRNIVLCSTGKSAQAAGAVVSLMKAVLRALAMNKAHTWTSWLLVAGVVGGAGLMMQRVAIAPVAQAGATAPSYAADQALVDLHGDALPAGALVRLGTVRLRPGDQVSALAFSPDGTNLVTAPVYSNVLQIWDRASGRLLRVCRGHRGTILQVEFTRDGRHLVSGSLDKTVRVWDSTTGAEQRRMATPWPGEFALSPDGQTLAVSNSDRAVHLWNIADVGKNRALKVGIENSIPEGFAPVALAFSPDGKKLATSERETLRLWDVPTGRLESSIDGQGRGQPRAACFKGGNLTVLSNSYGTPYTLWSLSPAEDVRTLRVEPAKQATFAFAADGASLLFASPGIGVRQWDASTGVELRRFAGMQGEARAVALSLDGKFAAAGTDAATLHQWETADGRRLSEPGGHVAAVDGAVLGRDRVAATVSADGTVHVWDSATGKERWRWRGPTPTPPASVAFTPDGATLAVGGLGKGIRLFDSVTGQPVRHLFATEPASVLGIADDGQTLVSVHYGRTVRWWNLTTGAERACFPKPSSQPQVPDFAFWFAAAGHPHPPCAALSRDSRLVALGDHSRLRLLQLDDPGQVGEMFQAELDSVACLAIAHDGKHLASAGDDAFVLIWNAGTGKAVKQFPAPGHHVTALAYSPDGKLLAGGTARGVLLLWELATGQLLAQRTGHASAIQQLAFSQDSARLISAGGTDTTALIWDVRALAPVRSPSEP
jgi:WD40 repeat protein